MFGERPVDGAASSPEVRSVSDESRVGRQRDRSAAEQCGLQGSRHRCAQKLEDHRLKPVHAVQQPDV